jgi:hypothetical protein
MTNLLLLSQEFCRQNKGKLTFDGKTWYFNGKPDKTKQRYNLAGDFLAAQGVPCKLCTLNRIMDLLRLSRECLQ